jgi:hypothetical protein
MPWNIHISTLNHYRHDQKIYQSWKTPTNLIDKSKKKIDAHRQHLLEARLGLVRRMTMASRIDHGHTTGILDEEGDLLTLMGKGADLHRMDRM